jgi:hypothetical protein
MNTNTNTNTDVFALILEEANQPRLTLTYEDPVITVDGSTAERTDCTRVGSNSELPRYQYATWEYYTAEQLEAADNDYSIRWIESRNEYYQASLCQ